MLDALFPSSVAVVALGLVASVGWGTSDFGGGLASRRAPVLGVLLLSQLASLVVAVPLLAASGEPAMRPFDIGLGAIGGLLGATGLALLYRGLSVGRMGVVAPVAAVLTATLPVLFGFLTQGIPSMLAVVGIVVAILSVVLVSRTPPSTDGRPSGLPYALVAGTLFGLFPIVVDAFPEDLLMGPVVAIRIASILAVAAWILLRRQPWRVAPRMFPALLLIGLGDMVATASYLAAIAIGPLAIAAILASLYPVVTAVLAAVVLRERMTRLHIVGIAAAGASVALIAGSGV